MTRKSATMSVEDVAAMDAWLLRIQEERERLGEEYEGDTFRDVANRYGMSFKAIKQRASRMKRGIRQPTRVPCTCDEHGPCGLAGHIDNWKPPTEATRRVIGGQLIGKVYELSKDGLTPSEISKELDCHVSVVRKYKKYLGLSTYGSKKEGRAT